MKLAFAVGCPTDGLKTAEGAGGNGRGDDDALAVLRDFGGA
jgi:hypothetical protein